MASLTVRNIPEDAKRRFRQIAAAHGRSMEEHLRQMIVGAAFAGPEPAARVKETPRSFRPPEIEPQESWVQELVRIANGAGEGLFDPEPQPLRDFDL